jgi:hypothetical protein
MQLQIVFDVDTRHAKVNEPKKDIFYFNCNSFYLWTTFCSCCLAIDEKELSFINLSPFANFMRVSDTVSRSFFISEISFFVISDLRTRLIGGWFEMINSSCAIALCGSALDFFFQSFEVGKEEERNAERLSKRM